MTAEDRSYREAAWKTVGIPRSARNKLHSKSQGGRQKNHKVLPPLRGAQRSQNDELFFRRQESAPPPADRIEQSVTFGQMTAEHRSYREAAWKTVGIPVPFTGAAEWIIRQAARPLVRSALGSQRLPECLARTCTLTEWPVVKVQWGVCAARAPVQGRR